MDPSGFVSSQITPTGEGEPAEIDRGLGLARAHEHASVARLEREDVARFHEVVRLRLRIGEHLDRASAVGRADAGGHALARVDAHRERGPQACLVARDHLREVELLKTFGDHRYTDHAARVFADERDVLRTRELRRHREVALVLTVLVVDDDHHLPAADVVNGFVDRRERTCGRDHSRSLRSHALHFLDAHSYKSRQPVTLF